MDDILLSQVLETLVHLKDSFGDFFFVKLVFLAQVGLQIPAIAVLGDYVAV